MTKHIPYSCCNAAIIGAIIFAILGDIRIAGTFLVVSGFLYLVFSEQVFSTSTAVEEKYPSLRFLSKLVGGSTLRSTKMSGFALLVVGLLWLFYV